jgi:hypothetical protein
MSKAGMLTAGTEVLVKEENPTNGYIQIVQPVQGWVHGSFIEKKSG